MGDSAKENSLVRKPNYALLLPVFYAPVFPLARIALNKSPYLPFVYGGLLTVALAHAGYVMFSDSTV